MSTALACATALLEGVAAQRLRADLADVEDERGVEVPARRREPVLLQQRRQVGQDRPQRLDFVEADGLDRRPSVASSVFS